MTKQAGFLKGWFAQGGEGRRPAADEAPPLAVVQPAAEPPARDRKFAPSPFGAFGEDGERVGEHIAYFLSRLDDVYALRQEFAAVAEPMQSFIRSHDEAQTRLAETTALLSRERAEALAMRAEYLALRARQTSQENDLAEARHQLTLHADLAETRGSQLRALQITHDDVAARLGWATRQLEEEAQTIREQGETHRVLTENAARLEQELAADRGRIVEIKDAQEAAAADAARFRDQIERLQPGVTAAKRRISELEGEVATARATAGALELKLMTEQDARRAADAARFQERSAYDTDTAEFRMQVEALEGRHQLTARLLDQSRALLNEKIDELRVLDRAAKDVASEKGALQRRLASAQDEARRLNEQLGEMASRNNDAQERCSMLTNALAAKDVQIEQLATRVAASKSQLDEATGRYEQERLGIEAANRKLIEDVQSERAERALAQGALSIARNSREKLLVQLDEMKRSRYGRTVDTIVDRDVPAEANEAKVTPLRTPAAGEEG